MKNILFIQGSHNYRAGLEETIIEWASSLAKKFVFWPVKTREEDATPSFPQLGQYYDKDLQMEICNLPYINDLNWIAEISDVLKLSKADLILIQRDETGHMPIEELLNITSVPILVLPEKDRLTPIQKIVYGSDFQGEKLCVLHKLLSMASEMGAKIECLHVMPKQEQWKSIQNQYFEKLFYLDQSSNLVDFHIERANDVEESILRFAEIERADLVVIATHDQAPLSESLGRKFIRTSSFPLLVFHQAKKVQKVGTPVHA